MFQNKIAVRAIKARVIVSIRGAQLRGAICGMLGT